MGERKQRNVKARVYVNNETLLRQLEESHNIDRCTDELALSFKEIAKRYSQHRWFAGYSYREDLVSEAWFHMVKAWKKFDLNYIHPTNPEFQKNPFAFFTQVAHHAFRNYTMREKLQKDTRDAYLIDKGYSSTGWNDLSSEGRLSSDVGGSSNFDGID